jgi:hypothetical protein
MGRIAAKRLTAAMGDFVSWCGLRTVSGLTYKAVNPYLSRAHLESAVATALAKRPKQASVAFISGGSVGETL